MRNAFVVVLFIQLLVLYDSPCLPVNLKDRWYSASTDIRDDGKAIGSDPDCDSLKVLFFGSLGVFENIRELFDKKHVY